ncbi:hypothetical protein ACVWW5_004114 [Bradyrhizobium sp. LM3.4]
MDEMDVEAIDLGDELRQCVELLFDLAPVIGLGPVAAKRLQPRELHALRDVGHRLPVGPARCSDAPAQVIERRVGDVDIEFADAGVAGGACGAFCGLSG